MDEKLIRKGIQENTEKWMRYLAKMDEQKTKRLKKELKQLLQEKTNRLGIVASRQMQAKLAPDVEISDKNYRLSKALHLLN